MIVVTGASGFLGLAVVEIGGDVRPVSLRGLGAAEMTNAFAGARAIVHAAGLAHGGGKFRAEEYRAVNVDLTRAVADAAAAARVPRLVLVSSVSVYASGTPYAESKREGERVAAESAQRHGTQLVILRPATIIGEGDPGNVVRLIDAIARRRFVWLGSGANRKTLIHREDVARACVHAVDVRPGTYNIAGDAPRMREIISLVSRRLGRSPLHIPIPDELLRRAPLAVLRKFANDDVYQGSPLFPHAIPWDRALEREIDWYLTR
jgi:nucleoside-diphosphate-sugar epimerase